MRARAARSLPWKDPLDVLGGWAEAPWALAMISGGAGRWSYLALEPEAVVAGDEDPLARLADLLGSPEATGEGPPFAGGVAGLASYGLARRIEGVEVGRLGAWPEAAFALYLSVLAFDHEARRVWAIGRGGGGPEAHQRLARALAWLQRPSPPPPDAGVLSARVRADDGALFEARAQEVRDRIAAGEIFQANIARRWTGELAAGARPFDVFARLCRQSPAPFSSYLRLPASAIVSNSPERFVAVDAASRIIETRPIKGTAPRFADAAADARSREALAASDKDRAENLMIVDLMRNDLSRICESASVVVPELCRVESFVNVHHLGSAVTGRLKPGAGVADVLRATFPPGSITGAPKVQAMKVIAGLEPPRGPFFGAMFWAGFDGGFDSSVLIRTLALTEEDGAWSFEARAGGGIVADSDPAAERRETEDKMAAILRALTESAA